MQTNDELCLINNINLLTLKTRYDCLASGEHWWGFKRLLII